MACRTSPSKRATCLRRPSAPLPAQLHWGTWKQPRWLDTVQWLADEQAAGRFKHLGLVNFDAEHVAAVLDRGIKVAAVQVRVQLR